MATITQTKLVGFGYGNKANYNATNYANHIWFDPTNKQILLNGIEYIPKKLSELVNDSGFLTSITKAMVEGVLTGNITSHTHSYLPLSGGTMSNTNLVTNLNADLLDGYHASSFGRTNLIALPAGQVLRIYMGSVRGYLINIQGTNSGRNALYFITGYGDGTVIRNNIRVIKGGLYNVYFNGTSETGYAYIVNNGNYTDADVIYINPFGYDDVTYTIVSSVPSDAVLVSSSDSNILATLSSNVASSSKWATARTITLTGSVTGSVSIDGSANVSLATTTNHTHNEYLPLTGGTLSGSLTCNGSYINMNGDSGAKGYKGYFNQSGTSNRASGSHVFMGNGQALGSNAISLGYNAFAGIRNQDADKTTYPYIAWQWMPTEKIHITINNQDTANGEFYGYEVLGGKMVQYELGGNTYTYENTSTTVRVLVCVKDDADTGLIFGGKSYMPYNVTKTLIQGRYILGRGESITNINTITVGEVNYYVLAIYTWSATVGYDYSTQVKVMCATKVNNSNYNGASSYASGYYSVASGYASVAGGYASVASGESSVASGYYSVASGHYSVASGYYSVASHNHCVVLARNGETMSSYQTIVGKFNAKVAGLFIIGNGTSDTARSNAFVVDDSGNVTAKYFSGYANAVGGEGFKIYPENTNQINFGGTGSDTTVVFGAASKDSRSVPTTYKFGANGTATIQAEYFSGYANAMGNKQLKVYTAGQNEINFGGTSSSTTIYFGYRSMDSRPTPTTYNFGNGTATIKAASFSGNAATATALTSSAGSATQPIYFSNGKPVACTYTLGKSVPSNAVFTDTTYSVATASADGLMSAAMFKAQMVKSVGVQQGAEMVKPDGTITITDHRVYITQDKSNINGVYQTASGDNNVKIPNATKDYDGSMSYTDKRKIDGIHNNCVAASVYVLNLSYAFTEINGLTLKMANFSGLSAAIASGNRPDMIRLVTNFTTHIFTLYDSTNAINDGSFFYYRCDGKNAEISIEDNQITFSVN